MLLDRAFKRFIKGEIKNKIIVYSIGLLLSNLLIIGVISYIISSASIMDRISSANVEIINQSMGGIDFILKSIESTAIQTFDDLDLAEQLDKARYGSKSEQLQVSNTITNKIDKLLNLRNEIDYIYVIGENYAYGEQKGIYSNETYARLQVMNEDKFRSLLENQGDKYVWTYVVKEGLDVVPLKKVGLCRAILDKNNNFKGFVLIMLREGTFNDIYSNLFQNRRQVYLVDQEGSVVSSPERDSIGKLFSSTFSLDIVDTTRVKTIDNRKYVISSTLSQYTGWKLYMVEPKESIISSISTIKWWIFVVVLTCIIVFITLSILLSNILTNPIKKLKKRAAFVNDSEAAVEKLSSAASYTSENKKPRKRSVNFGTKLFIMLFTIIIIPVILLMGFSYYISYDIVKTKSAEINLLNAKQIRIKLEYYLSSFEKSIYDLYAENELNSVLRQLALGNDNSTIDANSKKILDDVLLKMVDKNRDIIYTQLYDVNKKMVGNYGSNKQNIPADIFKKIGSYDETKNIWYGPYLNYFKQNVITLGKRIKDMNDFINTGYMFVSLKENDLEGVYRNFNEAQNISYIIDSNGFIISHPNNNLLNTRADYNLINALEERNEQIIIRDVNSENRMVSFDTIRNTGWKVVHISSMSSVSQNMKQMLAYFIIVLFLTCISIAIITFKVSRRIGRPLNELGRRVRRFASGDMTLENVDFSTGDEIEQLNNSFNNMMQRIRNLIEEVYEAKIRKHEAELNSKEAELTLLQAQINPHFLYNTLEIIRWKAMFLTNGENEVTEMVSTLSDFFRLSLSKGKKIITLRDEIEHAKNYITIMNYRYTNEIVVEWHVDESLMDRKVPKIILQPIIENAIYHGIKPKTEQGIVSVHVRRIDNNIELEVKDNGVGMSADTVEKLNGILSGAETGEKSGYGLRNVNQRIKLIFGDNSGIQINSVLGYGTSVRVNLPEMEGK